MGRHLITTTFYCCILCYTHTYLHSMYTPWSPFELQNKLLLPCQDLNRGLHHKHWQSNNAVPNELPYLGWYRDLYSWHCLCNSIISMSGTHDLTLNSNLFARNAKTFKSHQIMNELVCLGLNSEHSFLKICETLIQRILGSEPALLFILAALADQAAEMAFKFCWAWASLAIAAKVFAFLKLKKTNILCLNIGSLNYAQMLEKIIILLWIPNVRLETTVRLKT